MKFRALLLSGFLLMAAGHVRAQIVNEIKAFVDSTELVVNNGRKLMLQKLNANDLAGTREIYQYLNKITESKDYKAFEYGEKLQINLLTRDWESLLPLMKGFESEAKKYTLPGLYPIWSVLYEKTKAQQDSIGADLENAALNTEDKDVLRIYQYLMKTGKVDENYNKMLTAFNKSYRETAYKDFLKDYMPAKRVDGSLAFSLGAGAYVPTKQIRDYFQPTSGFNMNMDVNIGRVYTSLYMNGTIFSLEKPFAGRLNDEIIEFKKGDEFNYVNGGVKAGYFLLRSKRFHAAPYISLTGAQIESMLYDDEDDDEFTAVNSFACGLGIHSEVKIVNLSRIKDENLGMGSYLSLKIDGGYNQFTSKRNDFGGNMWDLNFSLVWGLGMF